MKKLFLVFALSLSLSALAQDDFKVKAFHIDHRIQVMPIQELKDFAAYLHESGINTIIMEWEASFPYTRNGIVSNRFAYTKEEVRDFISYCAGMDIQVIPLLQCLGHLEYVLKYERYAALREDRYEVSQLCPLKKEAVRQLYSELLSEIIALHPSKYVHIGGDEAYLLGRCPQCKDYVHKHGKSALFVDHINMITELITEKGKVPVLWADIIMKYPEAIDQLPDQSVLVNWNYGWGLNHFGDHSNIVNSGLELWGALSLRSWPDNYFLISWRTHFKNLEDFIPLMREHGYEGVVMTSWSTSGLYTFLRETKYHIVEMYPIRHVYPLAGLKMSVDAYTEAINAKQFDAHEFVSSYARDNFGLNPEDAETFWKGLNVPVETIEGHQTSRKRSLSELAAETRAFSDFLNRVKVNSNKKEFAYYRLLYDIRQYYIDGKLILVDSENMDYHPQNIHKQLTKLDALKSTGKKLDRRFKKMYKGSLYPALITEENYIRNREMEVLYHKLNRSK